MLGDYFALALGNLKHRGLRSWLTILGIFIGIAAVVALISMGQALQTAVTGQFAGLSVDRLTIQNKGSGFGPPGSTVVEKLNDNDLEVIKNINGVDKVVTRLIRVANIEYNDVAGFSFIADIPQDKELANFIYESFSFEALDGRLLKEGDSGKVVLGNHFVKESQSDFGKLVKVGKKILINGKDFEIIGILKETGSFQLNDVAFVITEDLEEVLEIKDEIDLIVVQVQDKDEIEDVAKRIEDSLRRDRNEKLGEESFEVETPIQTLGSINTILNIINLIVVGIAALSLVVGGVGIANTMYTSVVERTKEIGVMKAVGAKNQDVLILFLIEAGLLGLVGGIVGAVIGLVGAVGISNLANNALGVSSFAVIVSYPLLAGAIGFSFFVGILSGILPAIQASKLNVVDALRK
ncbi:MAG: ABC transporter permease [Candidatus Nanoarchaeia archaeon]